MKIGKIIDVDITQEVFVKIEDKVFDDKNKKCFTFVDDAGCTYEVKSQGTIAKDKEGNLRENGAYSKSFPEGLEKGIYKYLKAKEPIIVGLDFKETVKHFESSEC